jgi:hypothetical protein
LRNAVEWRIEYTGDGRLERKEWAVGPIVPWSIVALVALFTGKAMGLPQLFWEFLRR